MGLLHLALDLGSSSGKIMTGEIMEDQRLQLREVGDFKTPRVWFGDHTCIDVYRIYEETLKTLSALSREDIRIDTLGADSWSSDYGIVTPFGALIGLPVFYRDWRTCGMPEQVEKTISYRELYQLSSQQRKRDATLCQILALQREAPELLEGGNQILFLSDLLMFFFSGRICTEFSLASYSQLYSMEHFRWEDRVFDLFKIPKTIQTEVVHAGDRLGRLSERSAKQLDQKRFEIITPAGHDTASAIAAVPADETKKWAFIATGSWYLVGMELDCPTNLDGCFRYNFSNTGMAFGKTMLKRNITAMWILQECMRSWQRRGICYTYPEIHRMAEAAEPFCAMLDVDAVDFFSPEDMPEAICAYLRRTGQRRIEPDDVGRITRLVDEAIALKCAYAIERLEKITGTRLDAVYMVGGAVEASVLNGMIADATNKEIIAGPKEATCIGNCLLQAYGSGEIGSESALRQIVKNTWETERYFPRNPEPWRIQQSAFREFCGLAL